MTERVEERSVTRRDLLTKVGVGAAAAWAVPMLSTGPAGAAPEANTVPECVRISRLNGIACRSICSEPNPCSTGAPCFCGVTTKGCCYCANFTSGCTAPACDRDSECASGRKCVDAKCCGNGKAGVCLPRCKTPALG
jgi:hypothetical protein